MTDRAVALSTIGLAYLLAMLSCPAQGTKPPSTGELFNYEGTLSLSDLKADDGVAVSITSVQEKKWIKADFSKADGYPGIFFPIPAGGWDLSDYTGVQIELSNPNDAPIGVNMRIDNDGDWKASPWNANIITVGPKETTTLKVTFGESFNAPGFKLDAAHVSGVRVFVQGLTGPSSLLVGKPVAFKDDSKVSTAGEPVAAMDQTYVTTTESPGSHAAPYGQQWELVKDWTFGNKRPDATVHNKAELDRDFYYRYIYEKGKLDTLSTYWSVHRDYPEGDPKSLHVFGPDTLTLKGRIPPGGGLHKGGIESGLLRAKLPFIPGMYTEMRCKVPKGVGSWPAYWLGCGVEYDDGTDSDLPWPPEIDIFEFFGFRNRAAPKMFSGNYQTNKKPELYGKPHDIFTVFTHSDYTPGMDFSKEFHVFALDWIKDRPVWLLDGHPLKQTYYEWNAPPAHILVGNQLGIEFAKDDMKEMTTDESNWDFVIDYLRVWKHPGVVVPSTVPPSTKQ